MHARSQLNYHFMNHPFWGEVEESWAGQASEYAVTLPGFEEPVEVFLGEELDEEDEEYAPTPAAPYFPDGNATLVYFDKARQRLVCVAHYC